MTTQYFELMNGVQIPAIGFGTWQIESGKTAFDAVTSALRTGYRHIDTANAYGNEKSVGEAVRASGIKRSDIFVTSKLPAEVKSYKDALTSFEDTFANLGLDYLDLYLIHAPWPWAKIGEDYTKENIGVWKAMEEFYKSGRCRAIGVSNFNVSDLQAILDTCTIKPMVNQIKYYIGYTQEEVSTFCQQNDILVEAYSPFATGRLIDNKILSDFAKKYNKTVAQISMVYILQRGALPLPKSITPERIKQNFELDFVISTEDMDILNKLEIKF